MLFIVGPGDHHLRYRVVRWTYCGYADATGWDGHRTLFRSLRSTADCVLVYPAFLLS